ncbi:ParB/RepB/Spo0J family partition protein [Acidithiobacillus thiooxidans]|uniref:ParB/RepB/Spo0J family partition protein n=1 Tax=Acidithiobacillus thiooxidans TaxID=930 RepID=UPI001C06F00F|nr:ParB/RepB/Spo0J family partition protein [Acidithiobacillus thiooxidans]MBU2834706.1 ParB/RepB/Spo0J family partition protein [Acidithiobacillus thiooxidans]
MKKSLLDEEFIDLFADDKPATPKANPGQEAAAGLFIPLEQIQPDPDQPRKLSSEGDEDLRLLAESIVQHGILQPITVQPFNGETPVKYQIIAGERRWRAALIALQSGKKCQRKGYDLKRIPVFIRDPESETDRLEMQMVENLAREGMSDTDISRALNKLISKLHVSKAEMARRLGRSDTWVKNILTRADPDTEVVIQRIGVPVESIGSNEVARLVSWSKDKDKQVILDQLAEKLRDGATLSRALLDTLEERYDFTYRFPQLKNRTDLSLDDLRTWKNLWESSDPAQNAVANRVLKGMTLAEAMQAPEPVPDPVAHEPVHGDDMPVMEGAEEPGSYLSTPMESEEFQIGDEEATDAVAARSTAAATTASPTPASPSPKGQKSPEEEQRDRDTAGLQMESDRGGYPVAQQDNRDVHVRVPGDMVTRLLKKAGITDDLTVDADTVLRAMALLLGQ